ncbi:AraC family transcriptional regulator [Flavobacterium sp. ANB]|uniref:helix-turn-helix domain-containing protein n=1 Tax=unclassified Flavobacterium TaxID=196869 RepID=UPI0012B6EC02|nr:MULTISPECIES: helix-turn-helix domain-containing protein [unclassified Flavobacterium]MBF4518332.1 AraC family transcriptional regulator [Flavobacterium sp. ANB]MTD70971.1 helix-turn-helix domain-containing protein [Flavobacterium sp. LC2016-13]
MQDKKSLLDDHSQNDKLPIRIVSPNFGHLTKEDTDKIELTQRMPYYFILFMLNGTTKHSIDMEEFDIESNQVLFVLPNQIHHLPASGHGKDYFKLGFDENCLSRLPKQYTFLVNPLNQQKITVTAGTATRLKAIFEILSGLLSTPDTDAELILAHLNSLLTEINLAYFATEKNPSDEKLSKYIGFQIFVEDNLIDHPSITEIAEKLALSTDSLYQIVKQYSGLSPKEFVTNRLIIEARRRISYGESSTVKELAFELGFNDPDYFSRLFKKVTGKTVAAFFKDLS